MIDMIDMICFYVGQVVVIATLALIVLTVLWVLFLAAFRKGLDETNVYERLHALESAQHLAEQFRREEK